MWRMSIQIRTCSLVPEPTTNPSVAGQKPYVILRFRRPVWRPFRSVTPAWPKTIVSGHVGFIILYVESTRDPARSSVSR